MSEEQSEKKWYVYMLCDPDTQEPFYIGKGSGNRINYHDKSVNHQDDTNTAKKQRIFQIHAQGKSVLKKKIAEFDNEHEAYKFEVDLIKEYGGQLTNIKPGGGPLSAERARKPMLEAIGSVYTDQDPYLPALLVAEQLRWTREKLDRVIAKLGIKKRKFGSNQLVWLERRDVNQLKIYAEEQATKQEK